MIQNTFQLGSTVYVQNRMQTTRYQLTAPVGAMPIGFAPVFTPGDMLRLGVFEGKYLTDCALEYPSDWFVQARFSPHAPDPVGINAFKAKSRNPMSFWRESGWINKQDPRGWFEWYCRFYLGRRTDDDQRQIDRWRRFAPRHAGALVAFGQGEVSQRKATRQALLQWCHDPLPDVPCLGDETLAEKTFRVLGKKRL